MGDGAIQALQNYIKGGMPHNPHYVPRKRPRCCCIICQKEVEASEGLHAHRKMKHLIKETTL